MKVFIGVFKERGKIVFEDEAEEYVRNLGYFGDMSVVIPWFFSGDWIEKESLEGGSQSINNKTF